MHFKLVDIIWNTLVSPRTDFEGVISLKINAADTGLAENDSERKLVWVIEWNQSH